MTPGAWFMFVFSSLILGIALYMRFGNSRIEPLKPLRQMGVGMMCFGALWLWIVVDGIPEKYPNPALRIMTSMFWAVAGGLCIATYNGRRRKQQQAADRETTPQ